MFVRSLRLRSFRNYAEQEVQFAPGLAAFTGDNGQGKTNLLEAMCVLATTKSPLVDRERELMRWDDTKTRLEAEIVLSHPREHSRRLLFEWTLHNNALSRELKVGGVPQSALAQWLGLMQVVAFFPHDLVVIAGEPGERRRFLNLELGKARPSHFEDAAATGGLWPREMPCSSTSWSVLGPAARLRRPPNPSRCPLLCPTLGWALWASGIALS